MKLSKKNIFTGLLMFVCGAQALFSQTIIPAGLLTGTLNLASSPYKIIGNVSVPVGGILTVEAGVQLKFDNHSAMTVAGQLLVDGTQLQPVLFSVFDTTGFSNYADTIGGWHGINFVQSTTPDTSLINHAIFEYTKSIGYDWIGCAINFTSRSNVIVDSSEFRNCVNHNFGSALFVNGCSPWISNCYIHDNLTKANPSSVNGGAIGIYNQASPHFDHCTIQNNTSYEGGAFNIQGPSSAYIGWCDISYNFSEFGQGGGICMYDSSPTIYHNRIHHNTAYNGGGGIAVRYDSNPDINGNLICNNYAETCGCGATDGGGAIRVDGGSSAIDPCNPIIRNNVMCNNHTLDNGGGVYLYFTNARIYNNDIAYNYAETEAGGIYTWGSSTNTFLGTIENNIISANHANQTFAGEQVIIGNYFIPTLSYNIIDNGQAGFYSVPAWSFTCDSTNFAANPLWYSPPAGYGPTYDGTLACWLIPLSSPAHNAGNPDTTNCYISANDYANDIRFMENRLDIGAVEIYAAIAGVQTVESNQNSLRIFPNPANSFAYIFSENDFDVNSNVVLVSMDGKIIRQKYMINKKEIEIDLSGISSGMYTVLVESGMKKQTVRLEVNQ